MLKGILRYDNKSDNWFLKTNEKEIDISGLIYGFSDLNSYFPDVERLNEDGEEIEIVFKIVQNAR